MKRCDVLVRERKEVRGNDREKKNKRRESWAIERKKDGDVIQGRPRRVQETKERDT